MSGRETGTIGMSDIVPFLSIIVATIFGALCVLVEAPLWLAAVGVIIALAPAFLNRWGSWRSDGSRWAGVFLLFPAAYVIAYTLGSVPIGAKGPLGVRPDEWQWVLYVVGIVAYFIGAAFFVGRAPIRPYEPAPVRVPAVVGILSGIIGLGGAAVNYATGGVPAFSENINAQRFGENASALGPLTGFIVGLEQASLTILVLSWYSSRRRGLNEPLFNKLLVLAILASLLLSGSRSFLFLPLMAILFAIAEFKLIRPVSFALIVVLAFSGLTAYNLYRQSQSGTLEQLNAALEQNGVGSVPLASGLLGLQIGPSVMQMSREKIPSQFEFQGGQFFLADGSILLRTSQPPSDWFTTVMITGRSYAAVGGSPPTILGGFYIDGGVPLIVFGMAALGLISRLFRNSYLRNPTTYNGAAYGYWAAWLILSIYGYISLKPMVVTFLVVCGVGALVARAQRERSGQTLRPIGVNA